MCICRVVGLAEYSIFTYFYYHIVSVAINKYGYTIPHDIGSSLLLFSNFTWTICVTVMSVNWHWRWVACAWVLPGMLVWVLFFLESFRKLGFL